MNAIRERREALLMTQEEVAERAGLAVRTVQRAEQGHPLRGLSKNRLALALSCRVDELFPRHVSTPT